jgi:RND family efflux transporter MFP subunit
LEHLPLIHNRVMKPNKGTRIILVLALVIGVAWLFKNGLERNVLVAKVQLGPIRDTVIGNVKAHAASTFKLRSQANGLVTSVAMYPMKNPIQVESNQTLVQLEVEDLNREIFTIDLQKKQFEERREIGSLNAMALEVLQEELESMEELELSNAQSIASFDLAVKRNEVMRLQAQIEMEDLNAKHFFQNNQLSLGNLSFELSKRSIRSPISGEFSECFVTPGKMVSQGEIVGVVNSNDRILEVSLNEEDCVNLKVGMRVAVSLFSLSNKVLMTKISSISSSVDSNSGTRKIFLDCSEGREIPIGSSGRAEVIISEKNETMILPAKALFENFVHVVANGVVQKRQVVVGAKNLRTVEIVDGLKLGDQVIVEPPHLYKAGDQVSPVSEIQHR